jgi:hypothetical protein
VATAAAPGLRLFPDPAEGRFAAPLRLVGERHQIGRRVVGLTTVLGVVALAVLLGLALFHSALAEGQYRLSQVDAEVEAQRQRAVELQFELETLNSPSAVELVAHGVLGLVSASEPTDLVVDPSHIIATARVDDEVLGVDVIDWLSTKQLLTDP